MDERRTHVIVGKNLSAEWPVIGAARRLRTQDFDVLCLSKITPLGGSHRMGVPRQTRGYDLVTLPSGNRST
jgi:hypothetical protein